VADEVIDVPFGPRICATASSSLVSTIIFAHLMAAIWQPIPL
jgi:hypothetical protein